MKENKELTVLDTTFYKGLAITMIVFYHFFHWIDPSPGENQMIFTNEFIWNYINIISTNTFEVIQATFSYFGHYGVQIFIFLSAYGLTKRYSSEKINYLSFVWNRSKKIYIPFLISIGIWFIYIWIVGFTWGKDLTAIELLVENYQSLIYKVTLVSNFINNELFSITGPWWFISLIIQLYIVFPILLKISNLEKGNIFLLLISIYAIVLTIVLYNKVSFPIYGIFISHLPEFILGIYMAKNNNINISYKVLFISIIIFTLGNFYSYFWHLENITVTIILLSLFKNIRKFTSGKIENIIIYIGSISMFMFLINGFLRKPITLIAGELGTWYYTLILGLLYFLIVMAISAGITNLYNRRNK